MKEQKKMTREEWYSSPDFIKLRFLSNMAFGVKHKTQELRDVLELLLAENPELSIFDQFVMVKDQIRIVGMEASKLHERCRKLDVFFEPSQYTDVCKKCNNKWQEDGKCPICPGQTKP